MPKDHEGIDALPPAVGPPGGRAPAAPGRGGPPPPLTLAEFQAGCVATAVYPGAGDRLLYPLLGLIDEVGEAVEVVARPLTLSGLGNMKAVHETVVLAAAALGALAGIVKKAYRNVDEATGETGVLREDRLAAAMAASVRVREQMELLDDHLSAWEPEMDRVDLPRVDLAPAEVAAFGRELGDVGWYWNDVLAEAGLEADAVARQVLEKLRRRAEAGTLRSTGDDEPSRRPGVG
jgi:hypothetical protein